MTHLIKPQSVSSMNPLISEGCILMVVDKAPKDSKRLAEVLEVALVFVIPLASQNLESSLDWRATLYSKRSANNLKTVNQPMIRFLWESIFKECRPDSHDMLTDSYITTGQSLTKMVDRTVDILAKSPATRTMYAWRFLDEHTPSTQFLMSKDENDPEDFPFRKLQTREEEQLHMAFAQKICRRVKDFNCVEREKNSTSTTPTTPTPTTTHVHKNISEKLAYFLESLPQMQMDAQKMAKMVQNMATIMLTTTIDEHEVFLENHRRLPTLRKFSLMKNNQSCFSYEGPIPVAFD